MADEDNEGIEEEEDSEGLVAGEVRQEAGTSAPYREKKQVSAVSTHSEVSSTHCVCAPTSLLDALHVWSCIEGYMLCADSSSTGTSTDDA